MQTNVYVLTHHNCLDGSGSKYAAWKYFKDKPEYFVRYFSVQYNEPVPEAIFDPNNVNTEVYILDFSYPREELERIRKVVQKIVVLDHHKTAMQELQGLEYAHFDMNKSGCVLAWEYFFPNHYVPQLLLHVQDRDLWKWKLPDTDAILTIFDARKNDMHAWDYYCDPGLDEESLAKNLRHLKELGQTVVEYRDSLVNRQVKNTKIIHYKGYRVGILNATTLISEIGHAVNGREDLNVDFSMSFFLLDGNSAVISFRSTPEGPDVSVLAKELGQGGGHRDAAGVKVSIHTLCNILNEVHQ